MPGSANEPTVAVVPSASVRVKGGARLPTLLPTTRGMGVAVGVGVNVGVGLGVGVGPGAVAVGGSVAAVGEGTIAGVGVDVAEEVSVAAGVGADAGVSGSTGVVETGGTVGVVVGASVGCACTVACCSAPGNVVPDACSSLPQADTASRSSTPLSSIKGLGGTYPLIRSARTPLSKIRARLGRGFYSILAGYGLAHTDQGMPLKREG